jgi:hypothetical protein
MVLAVLAAAAPGCWLQTGFAADRRGFDDLETRVTAANVATLETRWTASVDGPAREALIDRGRVFVTDTFAVTALSATTGAEQWSTGGCCDLVGVPAVVDGQLRVASAGSDACHMRSVDVASGASTELAPFGPPLPSLFNSECDPGDVLAVGTRAIAPWFESVQPFASDPPCNRNQLFVFRGPGVSAVDKGPAPAWEHDETEDFCVDAGSPIPDAPRIGAVSSDGTSVLFPRDHTLNALPVDCVDSGCPTSWSVDVKATIVGPAVVLANGDFAVATSDGHVVVVDGTSHTVEWSASLGVPVDQPLAADDTSIFAVGTNGTLAAFPAGGCSAATCSADWTATLDSPASARPSIGGDVLYVGSADGSVTAFAAGGCGSATCDSVWTGSTPAKVTGAPAIFGGTLVVGSNDGTVTAFGLPAA